jgi:hypothetical protein
LGADFFAAGFAGFLGALFASGFVIFFAEDFAMMQPSLKS